MTILQAIILGIVQGLTEFIPISSTAHLIFTTRVLDLFSSITDPEMRAKQVTASIAVLQLGTLLAVLVYFASDILTITFSFIRDHISWITGRSRNRYYSGNYKRPKWMSDETWLGWLVIIGSIPIGVVGLLLKKVIESSATKNLWLIGIMMVSIAILLWIAEKVGSRRNELNKLGVTDAIVVGFAQVLALMPGASRSGSTIMGGLFAGQTRETAARFSFLLSIPAIAASGLLELKEAYKIIPETDFVPLVIGTLVAAVIGYASIWFLISFLKTRSTGVFIAYRLVLGAILLTLLATNVLSPQI